MDVAIKSFLAPSSVTENVISCQEPDFTFLSDGVHFFPSKQHEHAATLNTEMVW